MSSQTFFQLWIYLEYSITNTFHNCLDYTVLLSNKDHFLWAMNMWVYWMKTVLFVRKDLLWISSLNHFRSLLFTYQKSKTFSIHWRILFTIFVLYHLYTQSSSIGLLSILFTDFGNILQLVIGNTEGQTSARILSRIIVSEIMTCRTSLNHWSELKKGDWDLCNWWMVKKEHDEAVSFLYQIMVIHWMSFIYNHILLHPSSKAPRQKQWRGKKPQVFLSFVNIALQRGSLGTWIHWPKIGNGARG